MDVYQQVLHKLYEVAGGRDSRAADFKDIVKKLGFIAHYEDIFTRLNNEGWIIETAKADFVCLSHWGAAEVKKMTGAPHADVMAAQSSADVAKLSAATKELTHLVENFSLRNKADAKNDFAGVKKKFSELQNIIDRIEADLAE